MTVTHNSLPLSTAAAGVPVKVTATGHPAQLVHAAHASDHDFVTLWVTNVHSTDVEVTTVITANGVASSNSTPISTSIIIPAKSGKAVIEPGVLLTGSYELKVYASVADVTYYQGYIYRRTVS